MAQSWRAGSEPLCDHYTEPEPGSRYLAGMASSLQIMASHESAGREGALAEADQSLMFPPSVELNFSASLCKLNIPKLGGKGDRARVIFKVTGLFVSIQWPFSEVQYLV